MAAAIATGIYDQILVTFAVIRCTEKKSVILANKGFWDLISVFKGF